MNAGIHPETDTPLRERDVEAVMQCLRSGWLTMGPRTAAFEQAFADYAGTEHAVAVSSGTAALHLTLVAAGAGPGTEVVVPALGFSGPAGAAALAGADVVVCETAAEDDLNMCSTALARCLTPRTRAVVVTHMLGYPAAAQTLRTLCEEHEILLIEDCTQALGAVHHGSPTAAVLAGSLGHAGCFSFAAANQLASGEGGAVVTGDALLAERVRKLRSHAMTSVTWDRHRGHAESYDVIDIGFNYRIDEPRAALCLSRLDTVADGVRRRRELAQTYLVGLEDAGAASVIARAFTDDGFARSSHFALPLLADSEARRDRLLRALGDAGVPAIAGDGLLIAPPPGGQREARHRPLSSPALASRAARRLCCVALRADVGTTERNRVLAALASAV